MIQQLQYLLFQFTILKQKAFCFHRSELFLKKLFLQNNFQNLVKINQQSLSMQEDSHQQEQAVLSISIIQVIFYLGFLTYYIMRIIKLQKMATNNNQTKPKKFITILILICLLVILNVIHIFLSFLDKNYWLHTNKTFSLISIITILDLALQFYVILTEHRKNSYRTKIIVAQWIFMGFVDVAQACLVMIFHPSITVIIVFVKAIIIILLVIFSIFFHLSEQTNQERRAMSLNNQSNLLPLMQNLATNRSNNRIYIEFNKEFEVAFKDQQNIVCLLKIAVYVGDYSYIITKSDLEFSELRNQLLKYFVDDNFLLESQNVQRDMNPNKKTLMKFGEDRQKVCQSFLIEITRNIKYYHQTLMDFLKIPDNRRQILIQVKEISREPSSLMEAQNDNQQLFFKVQWHDDKILISNPDILVLFLDKSMDEIIAFERKVLGSQKVKGQISLSRDQTQIVGFVRKMVNTRHLWRAFAEWLSLGITLEDKIYSMFDFWYKGFKLYSISVIGHQIAFDKEGSVVTLYLLSITKRKSTQNLHSNDHRILKKRYNQFAKLDKQIKKFMNTNNIKSILPELPPKFSPFGSKTSPKSRQVYFDIYVKEIFKIEKMNHCVKLLQFLEVDSENFTDVANLTEKPIKQNTLEQPSFIYENQMEAIGSRL